MSIVPVAECSSAFKKCAIGRSGGLGACNDRILPSDVLSAIGQVQAGPKNQLQTWILSFFLFFVPPFCSALSTCPAVGTGAFANVGLHDYLAPKCSLEFCLESQDLFVLSSCIPFVPPCAQGRRVERDTVNAKLHNQITVQLHPTPGFLSRS